MERVPFQQDLSGMSCLLFPGRLLDSCAGSPLAGSSQMYHCTSMTFPEGFWTWEAPLWDFWNSSTKNFENLKVHFTSVCCTFSTCHLWESEAAQMGKPAGGRDIPALLNEKRLQSQLRHSTQSIHSAVILACAMVQSWSVPSSCPPNNIPVWLWGCFTRVTPPKANADCITSVITNYRFCTCTSMFSDSAFWNTPHDSQLPLPRTLDTQFSGYKNTILQDVTQPLLCFRYHE